MIQGRIVLSSLRTSLLSASGSGIGSGAGTFLMSTSPSPSKWSTASLGGVASTILKFMFLLIVKVLNRYPKKRGMPWAGELPCSKESRPGI